MSHQPPSEQERAEADRAIVRQLEATIADGGWPCLSSDECRRVIAVLLAAKEPECRLPNSGDPDNYAINVGIEQPAHSKSEYARRKAMGDTNVLPPAARPIAWLCEFIREDDTVDREVVFEDPETTRWADSADGDGVSPYRVTPLVAAPQPETPKADSVHVARAVPSELDTAALPEDARPWRAGLPDWATDEWISVTWSRACFAYNEHHRAHGSPVHAFARAILAAAKGQQ